MPLRVLIARLVLTKVIQDKLRAFHAAPVNSMMLWALTNASNVLKTRITATKEETRPALLAPRGNFRGKAVLNASRVVREHLAMSLVKIVKIAWWVNTVPVNMKMVLRRTQLRASVVQLVLQLRLKAVLNVKRAVLERSVLGVKNVL